MIRSIHLHRMFTHKDTRIEFRPGLTCITGPNEIGKSLLLEALRFALFGSQALRGLAEDYKGASIELEFEVRGEAWRVQRTISTAKLWQGEGTDPVATGTTPVNARIKAIFGYSLDVFDVANACCQGEIEALGRLKPTERKRLVDKVIGAAAIETMAAHAGSKALGFRRDAEAMRSVLVMPEAPIQPADYEESHILLGQARELRRAATRRATLSALVARRNDEPVAPTEPCRETADMLARAVADRQGLTTRLNTIRAQLANPPRRPVRPDSPCPESAAELSRHQERRQRLANMAADLSRYPEPSMSEAEVDAAEQAWADWRLWREAQRIAASAPKPSISLAALNAAEAQWRNHRLWCEKASLLDQGEHVCPACDHHWPVAAGHLARYDGVQETAPPGLNETTIANLRQAWALWDAAAEDRARVAHAKPCQEPPVSEAEIAEQRRRHADAGNRARALSAATALADMRDRAADLAARTTYEARLEAFDEDLRRWETWSTQAAGLQQEAANIQAELAGTPDRTADLEARRRYDAEAAAWQRAHRAWQAAEAERQAALDELQNLPDDLDHRAATMEARLTLSLAYESAIRDYDKRQRDYEANLAKVTEADTLSQEWDKGRKAMLDMRSRMKAHLAPSLSAASSRLISAMTGGQRNAISVDEDFEILVDGQKLPTLSGSAKAVTNLALRIALGQVLTAGVFPVLLLDEIDASMDQARAEYTMGCVANLRHSLAQVVVISHKQLPADHEVRLAA